MKHLFIILAIFSISIPSDLMAKERDGREKQSQRQKHHSNATRQVNKPEKSQYKYTTRQPRNEQSSSRANKTNQHASRSTNNNIIRSSERDHDTNNKGIRRTERDLTTLEHHTDSNRRNIESNRHGQMHTGAQTHSRSKHQHAVEHRQNKRHHTNDRNKKRHTSNHRHIVDTQKHRRHNVRRHNQHNYYSRQHYRGQNRYSLWNSGHGHYHYDYQYRYIYNPNQWYDDYYYQAYFDWRWDRGNQWRYGNYYNEYDDPYYCPDGFTQFVTGLTIGALIYNW